MPSQPPTRTARTLGLIAHADWSLRAAKRQLCIATRVDKRTGPGTRACWTVDAPVPVHTVAPPDRLPAVLRQRAGPDRTVFLGVDAAMGLPNAWGHRAGVSHFVDFLTHTVHQPGWEEFWHPAETHDQISARRPFYPRRPGGTRQQHLIDGLALTGADQLRRMCDRPRPGSPTPCPLFWTLGANQVGKATLTAWRELVVPALHDPALALSIWPFDGALSDCLQADLTLAEVYPGEVGAWLSLDLASQGGKRKQSARRAQQDALLGALEAVGATPTPALVAIIADGFGPDPAGEDAFDALLGVIGMLQCIDGRHPVWHPDRPGLTQLEGWVLGRPPSDRGPSS